MFLFFVFFRKIWLKVLIFYFSQKILAKSSYFYTKLFYFFAKIRWKTVSFWSKFTVFPLKNPKIFGRFAAGVLFLYKKFLFFVFLRKFWLKVLIFCFFFQKKLAQSSYFFFSHPNVEPQVFKEGGVLILTMRYQSIRNKTPPLVSEILESWVMVLFFQNFPEFWNSGSIF